MEANTLLTLAAPTIFGRHTVKTYNLFTERLDIKLFIMTAAIIAGTCSIGCGAGEIKLWYNKAADETGLPSPLESWKNESTETYKSNVDKAWERYALPVGNGFIGAMVYGGVSLERIQLNEHSIWSGGPGCSGYNPTPDIMDAYTHIPEIRQALLNGNAAKAHGYV